MHAAMLRPVHNHLTITSENNDENWVHLHHDHDRHRCGNG